MAAKRNLAQYRYVFLMRTFGGIYIIMFFVFLFLPEQLIHILNLVPKVFGVMQPLEGPADPFWSGLAGVQMLLLACLSLAASYQIQNKTLSILLLVFKLLGILVFSYLFLNVERGFGIFSYLIWEIASVVLIVAAGVRISLAPSQSPQSKSPPTEAVDKVD